MTRQELADAYRAYIDCLNRQDWPNLDRFVHDEAIHNGNAIGLSGYRQMLERDFQNIPDLRFTIKLLVSAPPIIASILSFDCCPKGTFLGLAVNGKKVHFTENVFYDYVGGKIKNVHSIIDRAAIEAQL